MNEQKNKKLVWFKRALWWLFLTIVGVIVGSFVTYAQSHYIYPLWSRVTTAVMGKRCCFKARDPIAVEIFAKQMTRLIKTGYIFSVTPEAAKIKIAPGRYDCKRTYLEVAKNVLDRNSGNIQYTLDPKKKAIHISMHEN